MMRFPLIIYGLLWASSDTMTIFTS